MDVDVIVIGGGPGGSTAATMLHRKGHRVVLLEKEQFPREHIGESLLPASMPILEDLGVMPAVKAAGFTEKWGATMVWGEDRSPWSWYFRETNQQYPHAYQVFRPVFDQILLENTKAEGVDVREKHTVLEVLFDGTRASGVRYTDGTTVATMTAKFIVDASGQSAILGNRLKLRKWDPYFQNLAVYGYFNNAKRLPSPAQGNILIESFEHGWIWAIPIFEDRMSVGVVADRRVGQEMIRDRGAGQFLLESVLQAPGASSLLTGAEMYEGPFILKDWSYLSDDLVGDGFILVGDAACFIDPLFSSGVHLALSAGVLAAAYITSIFKDPEMAKPAADVYRELYYRQYHHFHEMASLFYASNRTIESYFWEARRILKSADTYTPREAFVRAVAGQPPRGYERAVLEHGDAPEDFRQSVQDVEVQRTERAGRVSAAVADGSIAAAVPRLVEGVQVTRKPVLGDGEFTWGQVLTVEGRDDGIEVSPFVVALLDRLDGRTPLGESVVTMANGDMAQARQLAKLVADAVRILHVDGVIADLGLAPAAG